MVNFLKLVITWFSWLELFNLMGVGIAAGIGLALTAVGTGVAVYGQYQQGKAAEAAGKYNARLAERDAAIQQARALENIRRQRERNRRYLSRQRALIAGRGIAMEGTALQILGKSASNLDLEIQDMFYESQLQQQSRIQEANLARYQGSQAKTASLLSSVGTLVSGGSQLASRAYDFKQTYG